MLRTQFLGGHFIHVPEYVSGDSSEGILTTNRVLQPDPGQIQGGFLQDRLSIARDIFANRHRPFAIPGRIATFGLHAIPQIDRVFRRHRQHGAQPFEGLRRHLTRHHRYIRRRAHPGQHPVFAIANLPPRTAGKISVRTMLSEVRR